MGRLVIGMAAGALIAVAAMVPAAYKFRHDQREKGEEQEDVGHRPPPIIATAVRTTVPS